VAEGVLVDLAARPPPTLRAPDGAVWGWDDPGLPAAMEADLGMAVRRHRDLDGQQDLQGSVLVTTEASRLAGEAALGRPLELRRFRTNLHLDLDAPAFAEERWEGGRVGVGDRVTVTEPATPVPRRPSTEWDVAPRGAS